MKIKTPNFKNKRTQKTITNALGFACARLRDNKRKELHFAEINKEFGQSQSTTGAWLRYKLLTCVDESYSEKHGVCKKYVLNLKGVEEVETIMALNGRSYNAFTGLKYSKNSQLDIELGVEWALKRYDYDNFEYDVKTSRYWNPIQHLRKEIRNQALAVNGMTEQYDVECCAQTLMYQTYMRYKKNKPLMMMENYLEARSAIRNKIALDVGIEVDQVKQILTAFNNNGRLTDHFTCKTFKYVNECKDTMNAFNNHPSVKLLKADMSAMWKVLSKHEIEAFYHEDGSKVRITGSDKSGFYFATEKRVMDIAYNYLEANNKRYFRLHDAFVTEPITEQQIEEIKQLIRTNTNYQIKFDKSITGL